MGSDNFFFFGTVMKLVQHHLLKKKTRVFLDLCQKSIDHIVCLFTFIMVREPILHDIYSFKKLRFALGIIAPSVSVMFHVHLKEFRVFYILAITPFPCSTDY